MADTKECPICGAAAKEYESTGDSTTIVCHFCGGYKLSRTAVRLLENGSVTAPAPEVFKELVKRKRGESAEYPTITSHDFG
jgi:hypothetical protein